LIDDRLAAHGAVDCLSEILGRERWRPWLARLLQWSPRRTGPGYVNATAAPDTPRPTCYVVARLLSGRKPPGLPNRCCSASLALSIRRRLLDAARSASTVDSVYVVHSGRRRGLCDSASASGCIRYEFAVTAAGRHARSPRRSRPEPLDTAPPLVRDPRPARGVATWRGSDPAKPGCVLSRSAVESAQVESHSRAPVDSRAAPDLSCLCDSIGPSHELAQPPIS